MADIIPFFLISHHRGEYLPKYVQRHYDIKRNCGRATLENFIESSGHIASSYIERYAWSEIITSTGIRVTDTGYIFFNLAEGFN